MRRHPAQQSIMTITTIQQRPLLRLMHRKGERAFSSQVKKCGIEGYTQCSIACTRGMISSNFP